MDIAVAEQAAALVPKIQAMTQLVADLQLAYTEHWLIQSMRAEGPMGSASEGRQVDMLPFGLASDALSQEALATALADYESQLAALEAELAAL